ncbi:MAG: hypothetical protein OEY87_05860 [Gammaproteobacteria bacterium]|nr:hypothetical protein [Gammaproteobacteria bacterium]MDH5735632.1 hypothetical protein [Gammaproteobacteria bacterium]
MCGGIEYQHEGNKIITYFPNPKACLPVRTRNGAIKLMPWGRRKNQIGQLPVGGWARLESIKKGIWDRWFPKPVKIVIDQFMEKDIENNSHWFELTKGQCVQGLLARHNTETRIYVVTIVPEMPDAIHERWPRIMTMP